MPSHNLVFGPVPSRRLGMSLGVNNIPPKICSYSCVYCQLGRTIRMSVERKCYYPPDHIASLVAKRLEEVEKKGARIDYVTFVPDGEPTLDACLSETAEKIGALGARVAIITNSSLMWRSDVREDLGLFDYVSAKVDAVTQNLWRKINRPHPALQLDKILEGLRIFAENYHGTLVTETMLVAGVDYGDEFRRIAEYLATLPRLSKAYIAAPTRPPAEKWATKPAPPLLFTALKVFQETLGQEHVALLAEPEQGEPVLLEATPEELLSTLSVHPLPREKIIEALGPRGIEVAEKLVEEGYVLRVEYMGKTYYVANLYRVARSRE